MDNSKNYLEELKKREDQLMNMDAELDSRQAKFRERQKAK